MAKIRDLGINALPGTRDAGVPWLACETCFDDSNVTCDVTKDDHDDDKDKDKGKPKDPDKKRDDHKTKYFFDDAAVAQLKRQLRTRLDQHA